MTEQQTAAMRQALSKIKAARDCHPNAVQTLIFEAEELLESTLEQQPAAWVGLTDEEIEADSIYFTESEGFKHGAYWAEVKLKEKNK